MKSANARTNVKPVQRTSLKNELAVKLKVDWIREYGTSNSQTGAKGKKAKKKKKTRMKIGTQHILVLFKMLVVLCNIVENGWNF